MRFAFKGYATNRTGRGMCRLARAVPDYIPTFTRSAQLHRKKVPVEQIAFLMQRSKRRRG